MTTLQYPLVRCERYEHNLAGRLIHDETCCNGYGWLIKKECGKCNWRVSDLDCVICEGKGFTTEKLPKEGDCYDSNNENFTLGLMGCGCLKVKSVSITTAEEYAEGIVGQDLIFDKQGIEPTDKIAIVVVK